LFRAKIDIRGSFAGFEAILGAKSEDADELSERTLTVAPIAAKPLKAQLKESAGWHLWAFVIC